MGEKRFFENVDISDIWTKTKLSKCPQNNVIFLEILIYTDLWTKNDFLKLISMQRPFPRNIDSYEFSNKKRALPRIVDICGDVDQDVNDLKKRRFPRNVDIFGDISIVTTQCRLAQATIKGRGTQLASQSV